MKFQLESKIENEFIKVIRITKFGTKRKFLSLIKSKSKEFTNSKMHDDNLITSFDLRFSDTDLVSLYKTSLESFVKNNTIDYSNIANIWFQVYPKCVGAFHEYHIHENAKVSGVYYVKLPKDAPPTTFYINGKVFKPKVKEGDLLLFDSNLLHCSPPNYSNTDKIVVSFNIPK